MFVAQPLQEKWSAFSVGQLTVINKFVYRGIGFEFSAEFHFNLDQFFKSILDRPKTMEQYKTTYIAYWSDH